MIETLILGISLFLWSRSPLHSLTYILTQGFSLSGAEVEWVGVGVSWAGRGNVIVLFVLGLEYISHFETLICFSEEIWNILLTWEALVWVFAINPCASTKDDMLTAVTFKVFHESRVISSTVHTKFAFASKEEKPEAVYLLQFCLLICDRLFNLFYWWGYKWDPSSFEDTLSY